MKTKLTLVIALLISVISSQAQELSNKEKVLALLNSIESGDPAPIAYINPEKYIQHNLKVEDGLEGFAAVMKKAPKGGFKAKVVRAFQDGDYVFTHTEYDFFGPKVGFDIFRFEDGLIVEHWDNLAPITPPNPSGRTQLDGPTEVTQPELTEKNREVVTILVQEGFVNGKMMKAMKYIKGKDYKQHNSDIADNLKGLMAARKAAKKSGEVMEFTKNHMVLVEGEFALAVSEGLIGDQPTAFYDLFRVEEGKVVEHWDVIRSIPPKSEWKNNNGKF